MRQEYEFSMDVFDADGHCLGRSAVSPDWAPLAEHVHFGGIQRGVFPALLSQPPAELVPVWHRKRGEPFVGGVRIEMSSPNGQRHEASFPLDCFKAEAKRLSSAYVAAGTLQAGDVFGYQVLAARRADPPAVPSRMELLDIEEIAQPLAMPESSLQGLRDRSVCFGRRSGRDDGVLPVFAAQALVGQCVELVRAAGELETGGILLGRLHRDTSLAGEIFLDITAQIRAEHTEQAQMQVTFTDRTWAAARAALARRNSDEAIIGWWHSHPDFCGACESNSRSDCYLNGIFFSNTDCVLHRTMFPRAWQVGLLLSNRPAGIIPAMFSWRRGVIGSTPFHLYAPSNEVPDPTLLIDLGSTEALATVGGDEKHGTH